MGNISPIIAEWIKQGLDYTVDCIYNYNLITPIPIPRAPPFGTGQGEPILKEPDEGLVTVGAIVADSPFIGLRIKSGHPTIDFKLTLSIESLYILGLTTPNDYMWVPRYGTVVVIGGVNYTVYSMQTCEDWHWYKDAELSPINVDPLAVHNLYAYQYSLYKPLHTIIRKPIELLKD